MELGTCSGIQMKEAKAREGVGALLRVHERGGTDEVAHLYQTQKEDGRGSTQIDRLIQNRQRS